MTTFSASVRNLIGASKAEARAFCRENGIPTLVTAERIRDMDQPDNSDLLDALPAFQETFEVNLGLIHVVLDSGYSIKDIANAQSHHPELDLEEILEVLADPPEPEPIYEVDGGLVPHSTVMALLDPTQFSPLRFAAVTYEKYGVIPGEEVTIPADSTPLSAFLSATMPDATAGEITLFISDGFDEDDSVVMSSGFVVEGAVIRFERAGVATLLDLPDIGNLPMNMVLRGHDTSTRVKVWTPGHGEVEQFPAFVAGWLCDMTEVWRGLSAEEMGEVSSTDHETGELLVPEEGVTYVEAPTMDFDVIDFDPDED